jgi:ribonuclease J
VSGHAHREEIAEWLRMVRPRAVMPVHGDRRMLAAAAEIAREEGVAAERIHVLDNGDRLTLQGAGARVEAGAVAAGAVYLDERARAVEPDVLRERRQLSEDGVVVVRLRDGEVEVVSSGVAADAAELAGEVARVARGVLARATAEERRDAGWLRAEITTSVRRSCRQAFGLRPVIVSLVP